MALGMSLIYARNNLNFVGVGSGISQMVSSYAMVVPRHGNTIWRIVDSAVATG